MGKKERATLSFESKPDECFAGTGERFFKMDLSGQTLFLKNQDGQGVNNRRTYKNIPFYLSSRMYGTFYHTCAHSKLSLAGHSTRSVQFLSDQAMLDVFIIAGDTMEEILRGYRDLTGYPSMPPLWRLRVWMSRMTYFSADEVNEICDRMRSNIILVMSFIWIPVGSEPTGCANGSLTRNVFPIRKDSYSG